MAQRVEVTLVDDLDGSPADETIKFSYRGEEYEIDLSGEHIAAFDEAMSPWLDSGRRVGRAKQRRSRGGKKDANPENEAIREWARRHGYEIAERGRIPQEIKAAYAAASGA